MTKFVKLPPLLTEEQLLKRGERWRDPRAIRALMKGLREIREEIGRQEKLLADVRRAIKSWE